MEWYYGENEMSEWKWEQWGYNSRKGPLDAS